MSSPLGPLLLAVTGRGLRGVYFEEEVVGEEIGAEVQLKRDPDADHWPQATAVPPEHEVLELCLTALDSYFAGGRRRFDLPLDLEGTPFQLSVWQALQSIPFGETRAYGSVARAVGRPGAARAVGHACACNPASIVVPCHRVVACGGALGGYGGGVARKSWLLRHERALWERASALGGE